MQTNFYHFKELPFAETPNTKFYFSAKNHTAVLERLSNHLDNGYGFAMITGEVGTGKTMLTRYLINKCEKALSTAYIYWPTLETKELIETITREFGLVPEDQNFQGLEEFLIINASRNRRAVLFIDEAQALSFEAMEKIRLISNLESEQKKLIQIVLLGQPELNNKLSANEYRQIGQRISLRLNLEALPFNEMEAYIKHQIEVSKGSNSVRFDLSALQIIFDLSKGLPRIINLICRTALTYGAIHEARFITKKIILASLMDSNLLDKKSLGLFRRPKLEVMKYL